MIRTILVIALLIGGSDRPEAATNTNLELNAMNLFLEEITECMAFYNVQYNIRLKEQDFVSAQKALLYHQNLTMLATGLTHQTPAFSRLPQLHRSKLEKILQEMQNLYSKFSSIEQKYETLCLELTNNFEQRRNFWLARVKSQMN
ncbi:MAG: hypothetical protein ACR2PH_00430 [Desulfobulbia bacterium]